MLDRMDTETAKQMKRIREWHSVFVLISCCLAMFLHIGFVFSIGIFFTDVMTTFNSTRAETAVIQSTTLGVCLFSGLFIGVLINKFGLTVVGIFGSVVASLGLMMCFFASSVTYLIISVGLFSGFGFSCIYISSAAVVSKHFSGSRNQLLYMSLNATGSGIGSMVYPYFIRYLSDLYGFKGALLIIGAIVMNTIPGCILWRLKTNTWKRPERTVFTSQINDFETRYQVQSKESGDMIVIEKAKQTFTEATDSVYVANYPVLQDKTKTKNVVVRRVRQKPTNSNENEAGQTFYEKIRHILQNKSFMIFVIGMIAVTPTLNTLIIFVADIYQDNGLSNTDVSLGLFLTNVMSTVGRLLPGILLQSKRISPLVLPLVNALLSVVLILFFTFVNLRWLIIILTGAIGIPKGVCVSMISVVTLKLVGSNTLPIAIGIFFTLNGIGQASAGPVNGYIRDVTGSYTTVFYISAGINLLGAVTFYVAHIIRRNKKHEIRKRSSVFYLTSF